MAKRKARPAPKPSSALDINRRRAAYAKQVAEAASRPNSLVSTTFAAYTSLIDSVIAEVAQEAHHAAHTDTLDWFTTPESIPGQSSTPACSELQRAEPVIFPVPRDASGSGDQVECPHCSRRLTAARFAAHLEKCLLGHGRTARIRRRVNYVE